MDFRHVFLTPAGRLAPRPFAQAYILLTGAMLVVTVLSSVADTSFGVLQYALVFPYICVFGKRLHDAGLTAWLWFGFFFGYFLISSMLTAVLLPGLAPDAHEIQLELQEVMTEGGMNAALEEIGRRAPELARASALPNVLAFLAASAVIGFVAFRLRSDPRTNRHGPPAAGNGPSATNA